ncbi:hypothetical protein RvY_00123-1 [Ramazzottius varieornatus]|uniref:Uncharacterized protein n=1 Tax=Ramazzottius varieornatus TaxID=947166 RepID=A0A1D1UFD4_RAMVA|nr:hypothetical protein RvY_00123-1 [Ramazzottius varieornatus]
MSPSNDRRFARSSSSFFRKKAISSSGSYLRFLFQARSFTTAILTILETRIGTSGMTGKEEIFDTAKWRILPVTAAHHAACRRGAGRYLPRSQPQKSFLQPRAVFGGSDADGDVSQFGSSFSGCFPNFDLKSQS